MKNLRTAFLTLLIITFAVSCKKEFSYEGGNASLTSGTWQFQDSSKQYVGNVDSATINDISGTKVLTIAGKSLDGQENFRIRLYATDSFTTTTYLASLSQNDFDYATPSKTIFVGDVLSGEFTVTITSLSNNTITGTFSGLVKDSTNTQTQITLGTFSSSINLSNNGSGSGGPASAGTLGATADTCTAVVLSGTYTTGVALGASNTAQVQVNVTTPGSFIIATNSVNGVNFFKAGTFTTTGVQNVVLNGSGTPQAQGVQYFNVTYGTSNCTFAVTFLLGTAPVGDYFPTTTGSNWAYGLAGGTASDSILEQVIAYAPTFGGNVFATFTTDNIPPSGSEDTAYFRKSASKYITYVDVSKIFQFDAPLYSEYTFLDDGLAALSTFTSPDFSGTIGGVAVTGYIQGTITEKAVPVTIGSFNFSDVIKVQYQYFVSVVAGVPGVAVATDERWFARGVGLIYENLDGTTIYNIGRYTIF